MKCIDDEIPFEIPQSWCWVRLLGVGKTETGTTPSKTHPEYFGDYIPFIGPGNIQGNKIVSYTQGISEIGVDYCRPVPQNTILQVCIGGSIGKAAITTEWSAFNQQINSIEPYRCVDYKYVFYTLLTDYFKKAMIERSTGTATPIINRSNWEGIILPIPPQLEQQRIVARIEELMPIADKYEKSQEALDKLNAEIFDRLKKSVLQEAIQGRLVPQDPNDESASVLLERIKAEKAKLFTEGKLKKKDLVDSVIFKGEDNKYYEKVGSEIICIDDEIPFEIPFNWRWARMGTIGDWGSGSTPQRGNPAYYGGDILWLKTGELNNGVVYDSEEKITDKALQECSLRLNKIGDVLIAMYGATIGKVAIAGREMTTNQACCGCTPYQIYNKYLFHFLIASKDAFIKKGEGGAQPNISREKLIHHLIPIPPIQEQYRIVEKLEFVIASIMRR